MRPRTALVTYSPTSFDSRVKRVAALLGEAGHEVTLLSPDFAANTVDVARHVRLPVSGATRWQVLRNLATTAPSALVPALAPALHRLLPNDRAARAALIAMVPDVIHANDWVALPAAVAAARATGARLIYDTHEFAVEEHAELAWWSLLARPHVVAIERTQIGFADHVVTVGEGLAAELRRFHGTAIRALSIVRNVPSLRSAPPPPRSSDIRWLVYVGLLRPERLIDVMIRTLPLIGPQWRLRVIGFGPDAYVSALHRLAAKEMVADRVDWRPPVAPERVVEALDGADVGLFLLAGLGAQQRFALPNKLFEYTAAGLGVVASGSDEVRMLLSERGHGLFVEQASPEGLAAAVRSIDDARLAEWRARAWAAAQELNWEQEGRRLLAIYQSLLPACG